MFWNSALITPLMMICIYYGIPKENAPRIRGSTGLRRIFVRQRRSRNVAAGVRTRGKARLVALRSIQRIVRRRGVLSAVRAGSQATRSESVGGIALSAEVEHCAAGDPCSSASASLLDDHHSGAAGAGYPRFSKAEQIGPAIIWSAVPLIPLAFIAALLLLRKFDPRLLLAIGLACTALAAWLNSQYTSTWAAENFYRTSCSPASGRRFAFIGLVGCIVLQAIFAGALAKPEWFLLFRLSFTPSHKFGGTAGAIYMGHFLAQREKLHSNFLGVHVSNGDWLTGQNIHAMTARSLCQIIRLGNCGGSRGRSDCARVRLQAYSLSIIDGFLLIAWSCVCALILVALLRKSPLNYGELSTIRQALPDEKESKK